MALDVIWTFDIVTVYLTTTTSTFIFYSKKAMISDSIVYFHLKTKTSEVVVIEKKICFVRSFVWISFDICCLAFLDSYCILQIHITFCTTRYSFPFSCPCSCPCSYPCSVHISLLHFSTNQVDL